MSSDKIRSELSTIMQSRWTFRDGQKVPDTDDIALGNQGVRLDGTVLYADLVGSTALVNDYKDWFAAEVYKSYLTSACGAIKARGGEITAFDGDRVMAIFLGESKNTNAAKTALHINYYSRVINDLISKHYPDTPFRLRQVVGIDTGNLLVAKTGIRRNNDLVWIGKAANYAAKLCSIREDGFQTYVTSDVHAKLAREAKFGGNPSQNMWEERKWVETGLTIFRSSWWWEI